MIMDDSKDTKYDILKTIVENIDESGELSIDDMNALTYLSGDGDSCIRAEVARILVNQVSDNGSEILMKLAKDKDSLVRAEAVDSLSSSESTKVYKFLTERLKTERNALVKGYVVSTISKLSRSLNFQAETIALLRIIRDGEKSTFVIINISQALYLHGDLDALSTLIQAINSRNYRDRCAALHNLEEIINDENKNTIIQAINARRLLEKTVAVISTIDKIMAACS